MEKKSKDFIFSIVLIALGAYVIIEGMNIYKKAAQPPFRIEEFTISPGFLPVVLGIALVLCSIILLIQSLAEGGFKTRAEEIKQWLGTVKGNGDILSMFLGIVILGFYAFILMDFLPFWAASLIYLFGMFAFLKIGKIWKSAVLAVAAVGLVVLLFKYGFGAALP